MTYNCKSEDCNGDCIDIVLNLIKYFKLQFKLLSYVAQFHPRYAPPPSLLSTSMSGTATREQIRQTLERFDPTATGAIATGELGPAFKDLGWAYTRAELVGAIKSLDPGMTGEVPHRAFENFYVKSVNPQKMSGFSCLLVQDVVGKTRLTSRDLPPTSHAYGAPSKGQAEGAKAVILTWKQGKPSVTAKPKLDYARMNAKAAKNGLTTSRAFAESARAAPLYESTKRAVAGSVPKANRSMTYGRKNVYCDDIKALISGDYNPNFTMDDRTYPANTSRSRKSETRAAMLPAATKASIGHRAKPAPVAKEPFKMKRFQNVPSRVQTRRSEASK